MTESGSHDHKQSPHHPHRASFDAALDPETEWGIVKTLRAEDTWRQIVSSGSTGNDGTSEAATSVPTIKVTIDENTWREQRRHVRRATVTVNFGNEKAEAGFSIPMVNEYGETVSSNGTPLAPLAMLRLKPGHWHYTPLRPLPDEMGCGEHGATSPPCRHLLVLDDGRALVRAKIGDTSTIFVLRSPTQPLRSAPSSGGFDPSSLNSGEPADDETELSEDADFESSHPDHEDSGEDGAEVDPMAVTDTEAVNRQIRAGLLRAPESVRSAFLESQCSDDPVHEVDLHTDLENARLILAGHHLARAARHGRARTVLALRRVDTALITAQLVADVLAAEVSAAFDRLLSGSSSGSDDVESGFDAFEPLDDTNILSRFEHCRRVTRLGRGGIDSRSNLALALRDLHDSYKGRLCPLNTPESERVGLVRHLTLDARVDGASGFFCPTPSALKEEDLLSASALLLPALCNDDAVRGVNAAKSIRQFVPLLKPELPLIATDYEGIVTDRLGVVRNAIDTASGRDRVPGGGVDPCWITEEDQSEDQGGTPRIPLPGTVPAPNGSGHYVVAPGVNARCAVMPFFGLTIEDAVVVSESLAEKMRSPHLTELRERLRPNEVITIDEKIARLAQFDGMDLKCGAPVFEVQQLDTKECLRTIRAPVGGQVVSATLERENSHRVLRLVFREERALVPGDKVIARHGNKGVVAAVLPDEKMPSWTENGSEVRAELVISPYGLLRRMVIGIFHELALSRCAEPPTLPPLQPNDEPRSDPDELCRADVTITYPEHKEITSVASVPVGTLYLMKLNHLAESKLQFQDWTPVAPENGQPSRTRRYELGSRRGRPQRLGEMEGWALLAAGADELVNEALGSRRGDDQHRPGTLSVALELLKGAGLAEVPPDNRVTDSTITLTYVADDQEQVQLAVGSWSPIRPSEVDLPRDAVLRRRKRAQAVAGGELPEDSDDPLLGRSGGEPSCGCDTQSKACGRFGVGIGDRCERCFEVVRRSDVCERQPPRVGSICDDCFHEIRVRPLDDRAFGYFELPEPVPHPWIEGKVIKYLPVLPYALRPNRRSGSGRISEHPITQRYRALAALLRRSTVAKKGPSSHQVTEELTAQVHSILGNATGTYAGQDTIAFRLRHKKGHLRRYLLGTSVWRTAHAVIIPDPALLLDEVGIPANIMAELRVQVGEPVLVNRNPTLLRTGVLGMRAQKRRGSAVALPPSVLPMLAGDFDGDTVTIHAVGKGPQTDLEGCLHPALSLVSPATGDDLIYLGEELGIEPTQSRQIESAAASVRIAFGSDTYESARGKLREAYKSAYRAMSSDARGSVALSDLHHPDDPTSAKRLCDARTAGFGDTQRTQVLESVGAVATYRSRLGLEPEKSIAGNFRKGLAIDDFWLNARAAMCKLGDKKLETPKAGDFTKRLVDALFEVTITEENCGTAETLQVAALSTRANRRQMPSTATVRSPMKCTTSAPGICAACFGVDLVTGQPVQVGTRVGILAAQAIGERATQLALKAIHADTNRTELTPVLRLLGSNDSVHLPPVPGQGGVLKAPTILGTFRCDPDGALRLLRWTYTFADEAKAREAIPRDDDHRPAIDDIHLEVLVATLIRAAEHHKNVGPLTAATRAWSSPLARATLRGTIPPLLEAARAGKPIVEKDRLRDHFILGLKTPPQPSAAP